MKKFVKVLALLACSLAFVFALASCSNVSQSYADKINEAAKNNEHISYDDAVDALGDECVDFTLAVLNNHTGALIAVKGVKKDEYEAKVKNATAEEAEKLEAIIIVVLLDKCTSATYTNAKDAMQKANEAK